MKFSFFFPLCLFFLWAFSSCEKVIDVDVKESDKKVVIEGVITNRPGDCLVRISRTRSLSSTAGFDGVSGAAVQIKEANGTVVPLVETATGQYTAPFNGMPGKTYHLSVTLEGKTFTAVTTMPAPVAIDSLAVTAEDMFGKKTFMTSLFFADPAEPGNTYHVVQYQNGRRNKLFAVLNDVLSNGRRNTVQYYNDEEMLQPGDHVRVQLQSIDNAVYKYWYSLWKDALDEGNTASPANPVTNISGGALGYFSAQAETEKETVVK